MGRLIEQFCAACDASNYQSLCGQSLLVFVLALVGGAPVVDPRIRLDPYVATPAHAHIALERLVQGATMSESLLVIGLIRAIEDVLIDCSE